jgi:dTMP kinase
MHAGNHFEFTSVTMTEVFVCPKSPKKLFGSSPAWPICLCLQSMSDINRVLYMPELGKYIVLEGAEFVGKSTQARKLCISIGASLVREPGGTGVGESIRRMLLDPEVQTSPRTEVLLHAAQRAELMTRVVVPALLRGEHVVSDRSWISSVAYQGTQGEAFADIYAVNEYAIGEQMNPDLTIVLDGHPTTLAKRSGIQKDYYEQMDLDFHRQVRENYLGLAATRGFVIIDAESTVETVQLQIRTAVSERLGI